LIKCYEEDGPSPELGQEHRFTPAALFNISTKIVDIQGICQFNITWILNEDASIKYLKATKICVSSRNLGCIRCDYLERFPNQSMSKNQKWQFSFVGFSVEENIDYFIDAYNLPPANINEDYSEINIQLTSPDCEDNSLKYCQNCIEKGSLWDPDITICNRELELEVNFTSSNFCSTYKIHLCDSHECSNPILHIVPTTKGNNRVSEKIKKSDQRRNIIFKELIPYFPRCQNDCRRYSYYQTVCTEEPIPDVGKNYAGIFIVLFLIVCIVATGLYFRCKHGTVSKLAHFHPETAETPTTVLVIYSQETCFQHTVLGFAEFLQKYCGSKVIIDLWQKRRIAEIGPVQWLATQKEIADKIIFLCPSHPSPSCDSACKSIIENRNKNSESMFTLALHFFCGDWKMDSSLHKYMVVSFNETRPGPDLPRPLSICPSYFLMKDIDSFCRDLYFSQSLRDKAAKKCNWRFKIKPELQVDY
ncbi:interleukin-17 receptor B, partial [Python bivittatus]|uniref:Interleukin-17 receptor B n=1 Tax=Python bivittatus TaxID=176946 RepID=A0A9F2RA38_PYTBI